MVMLVLERLILRRLFPTVGFQIIIELRSTEDLPCLEIDKLSKTTRRLRFGRNNANLHLHHRQGVSDDLS
jgi:hypothetical protein